MATSTEEGSDGLRSSKLGTKEYWEEAYQRELKNFKENGDVGEVWFGYDSMERVVEWMEESPLVSEDHAILDIGCGNGIMLMELYRVGFKKLTGVDYIQAAVDLAKAVAKDEGMDRELTFEQADLLAEKPSTPAMQDTYDICVDKGTYDAICLNPEDTEGQRSRYIKSISRLLKDPGLLVITSCNFTEEELKDHFKGHFLFGEKIKTPSFMFGGKSGSRETSLIFVKKDKSQ